MNDYKYANRINRKVLAKMLALLMLLLLISETFSYSVYGDDGGYEWNYYRRDDSNNGIVSSQTPTDGNNTGEKWTVKFGDGVQDSTMSGIMTTPTMPIIVNGKMYIGLNKSILEINKDTGEVVRKSAPLPDSVGYAMNPPLYADGKIFMQLSNGKVCAVDETTFKVRWTAQASTKGQTISPLSYRKINGKGFVYTGTWTGENSNGVYFAVTTDDTNVTNGVKKVSWELSHKGGFYWAGAYATNKYMIIGSDDGVMGAAGKSTVYSLNPITGKTISSIKNINGDIRCSIVYENGAVYFSTTAGYIYKVKVDSSGKLGAVTSLKLADKSVGAPVVYKGRMYVGVAGNGGIYSSDGGHSFSVIKDTGASLKKLYTIPVKGFPRSGALISNAYEGKDFDGDGKADGRVYVYFTYNAPPGGVYCIYDEPTWSSQSDVKFKSNETELYIPGEGKKQYCISTIVADSKGTLYYRNDSAYMFALEQNSAELKGIKVFDDLGAVVSMSPGFDSKVSEYEGVVAAERKNVTVDVDVVSGATVKINGSDYTRYGTVTVDLKGDVTKIPILVTKSGKKRTYNVSIRKRGSDVGLSYLASNSSNSKGSGNRPMTPNNFSDESTDYSFNWLDVSPNRFYNLWVVPRDEKAKVSVVAAPNGNVKGSISGLANGRYPIYFEDPNKDTKVIVEVVSEDGKNSKAYTITMQREEVDMNRIWHRLEGAGRLDTMKAIVDEGFWKTGGTVVVATGWGFKDALAASGLAGLYDAPIVLTDGSTLSKQARDVISRLKPKTVFVAGGEAVVKPKVLEEIKKVSGVSPKRLSGANSAITSAKLALAGAGKWKDSTAIIATNKAFKDALSVAPIAYSKKYPILLADGGTKLSAEVLDALKTLKIKNVIIVGGKLAVTPNVVSQLNKIGITKISRKEGKTGVLTSQEIAKWGLSIGLTANKMGVATSQGYPDALAGAALCGYNNSVLVLADDKDMTNASFPGPYKAIIKKGYVFGGKLAVGEKTFAALEKIVYN